MLDGHRVRLLEEDPRCRLDRRPPGARGLVIVGGDVPEHLNEAALACALEMG